MELLLTRKYHDWGVNGVITLNGKQICRTIELPWRDNQRRISCIPEGQYKLRRRYSPRFGWHCFVELVPNRDAILIHSFNNALKESKGCIGPVTKLEGPGTGSASRAALNRLMELLHPAFDQQQSVFLTIKSEKNEHTGKGQ
jgi:hypothetical protein